MKKKNLLILFSLVIFIMPLKAQLLSEDFESGQFPSGWTTIETPDATGHWAIDNYMPISGKFNLYIDERGKKVGEVWPKDPEKTEYAITPEITLPSDQPYGVGFMWVGQKPYMLDKHNSGFDVAVLPDGETEWIVIWSANKQEDVEKSGVVFPWNNFGVNTSVVSLDDFKGQKIKIAFIYHSWVPQDGSLVRLDNIQVIPHTPITGPIVGGTSAYVFTESYIGLKETSSQNELILTNHGIGELEILEIEGLEGTDFSTNLAPGIVKIGSQKSVAYHVYYIPTESGNRNTTMVIKTNGGDLNVHLSGTKLALEPGYSIESFESIDFYPPGWTGSNWVLSSNFRSGDKAITNGLSNQATMESPLLDMSVAGLYRIDFDYMATINEEAETPPADDLMLQFSKDGGNNWNTIWTHTYSAENNPYKRIMVPVSNPYSAECKIRFLYKLEGELGADVEITSFFIDNIVLPPMVGANEKPVAATNPTPADGAGNQYVDNVILKWRTVLHAQGYKIYLGDNQTNPVSVINGAEVGKNVNTYIVNGLDNNKTYYWKIVPYNAAGDAENVPVWNFKTMPDMSIREFPFNEGFEGDVFPPLGWIIENDINDRGWSRIEYNPFEGKYSLGVYVTRDDEQAVVQTPPVVLPDDKDMQITFFWGNALPANLTKSTRDVDNAGGDIVYFEVKAPDNDWVMLASCSQEESKWVRQKVLLSQFKGKRVSFRWRYYAKSTSKATRASLDQIKISEVGDVGVPYISFKEWYAGVDYIRDERYNAGIVNFGKTKNTGEIFTLENRGEFDLKILSAAFDTEFFTSTLMPDRIIEPNEEIKFAIIMKGEKEQTEIKDTLRIKFEDGQTYKFPVYGEALNKYTYCYTFDDLEPFITDGIYDFKAQDVDGYRTFDASSLLFPGKGSAYAYKVMNWAEMDWRDVFPRSGNQVLMAANADFDNGDHSEKTVNDWLISKKMSPRANAQLRFYAKSYARTPDWQHHKLTVLVSTTNDNRESFIEIPSFTDVEIPCDKDDKNIFKECIIDLSGYADQEIYVAIRHNSQKGMYMFIDDIYFENFNIVLTEGDLEFMTNPLRNGTVGQRYTYDFVVVHSGGNKVNVEVKKPTWLTYTERDNGGTLTGIPTEAGDHYVRIIATSGIDKVEQDFDIVVQNSQTPRFVTDPVTIGEVGEMYTYNFTIMHPQGKNMTITMGEKPEWLTLTTRSDGGTLNGRPTAGGVHHVKINATDGTYNIEQEYDITVTATSLENNFADEMIAYPNPVADIIYITEGFRGNTTLSDLAGKILFKGENTDKIYVKDLNPGTYILQIVTDKENYSTRIIRK